MFVFDFVHLPDLFLYLFLFLKKKKSDSEVRLGALHVLLKI